MSIVTGASGLLGSHLCLYLLQQEKEVWALIRSKDGEQKLVNFIQDQGLELGNKLHVLQVDLLDLESLEKTFSLHHQVYHCAAMVSFNKNDYHELWQTNVEGTKNVIEACKINQNRLLHVSSIAALGRGMNQQPTIETDYRESTYRSSEYSKSKFVAEQEVWRAHAEGQEVVIVNPSVILGQGDWQKSSSKLFDTVYKGLHFYTSGSNGYVDVKDVAKAMYQLMNSEINGERYILNGANLTYQRLFELMSKGLNVSAPKIHAGKILSELTWISLAIASWFSRSKPLITKETARSANTFYSYSSSKIQKELDFEFTPIKQTINSVALQYLHQKS